MKRPFRRLLEPYRLNERIVLKNHITFPNALYSLMQGPETFPAEPLMNEIAQVCASGASLFSFPHFGRMGGGSTPSRSAGENEGRSHIPIFNYEDPSVHNYLCQVAAQTHMLGSKVLVKLGAAWPAGCTYGGGDAGSLFPRPEGLGVTFPDPPRRVLTREKMIARICPREEIPGVIRELVELAGRYRSWGFDGMSFRLDRYIDADTNLRTDEYGGPIENRVRFCYEVFAAMKKAYGPDFLIEAVMPGRQDHGMNGEMPHGYTLEEAIRAAKLLEPVVDIIQLREAGLMRYHPTGYNSTMHVHESVAYCRAFKEAGVRCTLSANAGFVDPEDMLAALESGACDLISAGRVFIAEPEFTRKLYEAPRERPAPCIQCDKCHGLGHAPWLCSCSVNPKAGMAHRLPGMFGKPLRSKRVAVIGGGPIGMRAACFAAEAGHRVTLFERTGELGGKLRYADVFSFKWPIRRYRDWLRGKLGRRGVEVRLNCAPDPDALAAMEFDAVIACTGSVAVRPNVPGADAPGVLTAEDVYLRRAQPSGRVAVVGGAGVATETAMHLAQQGCDVTIITRKDGLAQDIAVPHDGLHIHSERIDPRLGYGGYIPAWRVYDNLHEVLRATTLAITPGSVTYEQNGERHTLDCDAVVVTGGYRGLQQEALAYAACAPEFYMAGDVEDCCGNLQEGNVSAFGKCSLL